MEAAQKSPNVWSVGDTAVTHVWDGVAREYNEAEVRVCGLRQDGYIEVDYKGGKHLRPIQMVKRNA